MRDIRILNEAISQLLVRKRSGNVTPLLLSSLLGIKKEEERYKQIDTFFGENDPNKFTYGRFKALFDLGANTPFKFGVENREKLQSFGQIFDREDGVKKGTEGNDEYVETFFIYLYYEVFVKPTTKQNLLTLSETYETPKEISDALDKAKSIIENTSGEQRSKLEQGLITLTRYMYSMIYPDDGNINNEQDRAQFVENFINSNINLFIDYPLSKALNVNGYDKLQNLLDAIFTEVSRLSITDNSQMKNVTTFAKMINKNQISFDVKAIEDTRTHIFPEDLHEKVNNIMNTLCEGVTDEVLRDLGLSWTTGSATKTSWSNIVKIVIATICMSKLTKGTEKIVDVITKRELNYTKLLDTAEKDGGIHFINNMAFYRAMKEIGSQKDLEENKDVIKNMNSLLDLLEGRISKFMELSQLAYTNAILIEPNEYIRDEWETPNFGDLSNQHKNAIISVMNITGMAKQVGSSGAEDIIAAINDIFLNKNSKMINKEGWEEVAKYAAQNVADYKINMTNPGKKGFFSQFKTVVDGVFKSAGTLLESDQTETSGVSIQMPYSEFEKAKKSIESGDFFTAIAGVGEKLEDWKAMYDFLRGKASINKTTIKLGGKEIEHDISTPEKYLEYLIYLSRSIGSMVCHGKVMFANEGDLIYNSKEEIKSLNESYYNSLSYLIVDLIPNYKIDDMVYKSKSFDLQYRITPFAVEFLKYNLRYFINNIHKGTKIEKLIDEANEKETMTSVEWSMLVDQLQDYVLEKLKDNLSNSEKIKSYRVSTPYDVKGNDIKGTDKKEKENKVWRDAWNELGKKIQKENKDKWTFVDPKIKKDILDGDPDVMRHYKVYKNFMNAIEKAKKEQSSPLKYSDAYSKMEDIAKRHGIIQKEFSPTSKSSPTNVLKSSKKEQIISIYPKDLQINISELKSPKEWILSGYDNFVNLSFFETNGEPVGELVIKGKNVGKMKKETKNWSLFCLSPYVGQEKDNKRPTMAFSGITIIKDGNVKKFKKGNVRPRTCIGVDNNDKVIILTTVGATLNEVAKKMKDIGCVFAVNVDGGDSSVFTENGKIKMGGNRKIPVILSW